MSGRIRNLETMSLADQIKAGKNLLQALTVAIALGATTIYIWNSYEDIQHNREKEAIARDQIIRSQQAAQRAEKTIQDAINSNEILLANIKRLTGSNPSESTQQFIAIQKDLDTLKVQVSDLKLKVDGLNSALSNTPEKALALPLLAKDVSDLKVFTSHDSDSLRAEMDRNADTNKWLIGLILAAVLGNVISSALSRGKAAGKKVEAPEAE
jgi:hypothetical protein